MHDLSHLLHSHAHWLGQGICLGKRKASENEEEEGGEKLGRCNAVMGEYVIVLTSNQKLCIYSKDR